METGYGVEFVETHRVAHDLHIATENLHLATAVHKADLGGIRRREHEGVRSRRETVHRHGKAVEPQRKGVRSGQFQGIRERTGLQGIQARSGIGTG